MLNFFMQLNMLAPTIFFRIHEPKTIKSPHSIFQPSHGLNAPLLDSARAGCLPCNFTTQFQQIQVEVLSLLGGMDKDLVDEHSGVPVSRHSSIDLIEHDQIIRFRVFLCGFIGHILIILQHFALSSWHIAPSNRLKKKSKKGNSRPTLTEKLGRVK